MDYIFCTITDNLHDVVESFDSDTTINPELMMTGSKVYDK
jgi:hypothetical protein